MLQIAEDIGGGDYNWCYGLPQLLSSAKYSADRSSRTNGAYTDWQLPIGRTKALSEVSLILKMSPDMFADLRSHLQRMTEEPRSEWEPGEKNCAVILFKQVCQHIARRNEILISTNNSLAANVCSQHFGSDAKAGLLISDEDPKERNCEQEFPSNNALHAHAADCNDVGGFHADIADLPILKAKPMEVPAHDGMGFRSWKYATIKAYIHIQLLDPCYKVQILRKDRCHCAC
ncbi:uncharacterized protein NFIA_081980 [Aspergillus fischeri NRRL 181]|uniref:Uncharacterized protein n=1 Tax=Neosartorya fischeri (strain ATCC 1020 / DSM 3700 / CBS 544.65 / FGSC A1164 / JCM 1740 / NRRL 181 / WB 181) TaxID=331117 RepID=A1DFU4_NEOFI|nr:uncharacterized protein NFIA_081980 [Aspergillus fischeri NRRL 181]EAW18251.1 hypothetical protein NFIA_081980 [Aspergillus fischeri NRRL 181]